jgi:hypothetical protein
MTKPCPNGAPGGEKDEPSVSPRWDWTLGNQQCAWLKQTLGASTTKDKLVFTHHPADSGTSDYIRASARLLGATTVTAANAIVAVAGFRGLALSPEP